MDDRTFTLMMHKVYMAQFNLEQAINSCPTGELRNKLTDLNIAITQFQQDAPQIREKGA